MTTLPPNYLRLSSKWLETNPLPEDGLLLEADDTWKPSSQRGRITATPGFDYATARTDLPREAYADEPGAEVASERAEDHCGVSSIEFPAKVLHTEKVRMKIGPEGVESVETDSERTIATLRDENAGLRAEIARLTLNKEGAIDLAIHGGHQLKATIADRDRLAERVRGLLKTLEPYVKLVDRPKHVCGQYLGLATNSLYAYAVNEFYKAKEAVEKLLTPSQQPDNLKGGDEPCAPQDAPVVGKDQVQMITTQQDAQSTESASNPQPESPIPSGVGQPEPEPVKARDHKCRDHAEDIGECSEGCCDKYRCKICGRRWFVEVAQ